MKGKWFYEQIKFNEQYVLLNGIFLISNFDMELNMEIKPLFNQAAFSNVSILKSELLNMNNAVSEF